MSKEPIAAIDDVSASTHAPLAYSVEEAARLLAVGRTLGWAMVRSGELRSVRLGGRVVVPRDAIAELLDRDRRSTPGTDNRMPTRDDTLDDSR